MKGIEYIPEVGLEQRGGGQWVLEVRDRVSAIDLRDQLLHVALIARHAEQALGVQTCQWSAVQGKCVPTLAHNVLLQCEQHGRYCRAVLVDGGTEQCGLRIGLAEPARHGRFDG
jgi:hypothetical protein